MKNTITSINWVLSDTAETVINDIKWQDSNKYNKY